ncbi:MAG: DNA polymerase IV [Porticoccaceae bacterium]|nr:DNA polymerase IV [Porticoccaceae bacterium]
MDAFYASVEQRDNPELRGKPVIVGGKPDSRGVVAACSYEARKFGIHSAMPSSRAGRLCPDAIFVKGRFDAYREASRQMHEIFHEYTDLIEPLSLDEAYLDVTHCEHCQGSATLIAKEIKLKVKERMNLVVSAGVSYNKFLAKIASDMDKPDGLYVIRPEQAESFITTLPVRKFHGVGKVTEQKMHKHGIQTGQDLKNWSEAELSRVFGKSGGYYFRIARGIDNRPVRSNRIRKSIGKERTFASDLTDMEEMLARLSDIAEQIAELLTKREVMAKTVTLKVKYDDFTLITRAHSFDRFIQTADEIMDWVPALIDKTELGRRPCRLLGLSVSNLKNQNEFSDDNSEQGVTRDLWGK